VVRFVPGMQNPLGARRYLLAQSGFSLTAIPGNYREPPPGTASKLSHDGGAFVIIRCPGEITPEPCARSIGLSFG
jgi:hypothetical protein